MISDIAKIASAKSMLGPSFPEDGSFGNDEAHSLLILLALANNAKFEELAQQRFFRSLHFRPLMAKYELCFFSGAYHE